MTERRMPFHYTMTQVSIQRRNLVQICRLAVKSLLDHSCPETIDDSCEELANFFAIMEHIFSFRLKLRQTWYGTEEQRFFWDFIKVACKKSTHSCLDSIEALESPRSVRGKGRAWLRVALMEKRLSDYISMALQQPAVIRSFYQEGAILLSDEAAMLTGVLLGLNVIDFNFDIKSENLDLGGLPAIDYTPYIKFKQSPSSSSLDHQEELLLNAQTSNVSLDDDSDPEGDTWRERYLRLDAKYRTLSEQKGYLEELVRLRESQLEEVHKQRHKLIETLQHYEAESRLERQQLEGVIIELQATLSAMKEEHRTQTQQVKVLIHRLASSQAAAQQGPPAISLTEMTTMSSRPASDRHMEGSDIQSQGSGDTQAPAVVSMSGHLSQADSKSLLSSGSTVSATREDTLSMVPMAGSFTSQTSFRSGEVPHPLSPRLKPADAVSANEKTALPELVTSASRQKPVGAASKGAEGSSPCEKVDDEPFKVKIKSSNRPIEIAEEGTSSSIKVQVLADQGIASASLQRTEADGQLSPARSPAKCSTPAKSKKEKRDSSQKKKVAVAVTEDVSMLGGVATTSIPNVKISETGPPKSSSGKKTSGKESVESKREETLHKKQSEGDKQKPAQVSNKGATDTTNNQTEIKAHREGKDVEQAVVVSEEAESHSVAANQITTDTPAVSQSEPGNSTADQSNDSNPPDSQSN